MKPVRGFAKLKYSKNPRKNFRGNSSVTRVRPTFCNFWTLKSNILFTILLFSNQSCVLVDIRILYNMTLIEIYLIKDYAFTYN